MPPTRGADGGKRVLWRTYNNQAREAFSSRQSADQKYVQEGLLTTLLLRAVGPRAAPCCGVRLLNRHLLPPPPPSPPSASRACVRAGGRGAA